MFFTLSQFALIASLALAYVVSAVVSARLRGAFSRHFSTLIGCCTFIVGAILAAKNLLFLLTTTKPVRGHWGKTLSQEFIISPSDDPLIYTLCLALQAGAVILFLVLAYSVYSHRSGNEA